MKITELKCTACGGVLKIDDDNPNIAYCEYCRSRYTIEHEGQDEVRLENEKKRIQYTPREPVKPVEKTGWEPYGWKRGAALAFAGIICLVAFNWKGISNRMAINRMEKAKGAVQTEEIQDKMLKKELNTEPEVVQETFTGIFAAMAEKVLEKPAEAITADELSKFQWIELRYGKNGYRIGYSFEDPYTEDDAALTWLEFPRDTLDEELGQLPRFTGLKKLYIANYLSPKQLKGLQLVGLGCYIKNPVELLELVEQPENIRELMIEAGLEQLNGFDSFKNLEKLTISGSHLDDLAELVKLKTLRSLQLDDCDEITDFSVLSVMPWLEEVSVDSEGLRGIGFVTGMQNLKTLSLLYGGMMNLNELAGKTSLTSLSIENCDELQDCSSVAGLTGLEHLSIELPYNCPEPELGGLVSLKTLKLTGFSSTAFLQNMTQLEKLTLDRSTIDRPDAFGRLTQLKELKCMAVSGELNDWVFASRLPALEKLDMTGISTYEDISSLLNIPTLHTLGLDGVECELDFSKLQPNTTLKNLSMDGIKLYKNVQISGGNGIVYVDYDTVTLDENTGFLSAFTGLESLSLADNKLTNISFASALPALKDLDIQGNYVTDLKPLESLSVLRWVDCKGNPVENYRVLPETVIVNK